MIFFVPSRFTRFALAGFLCLLESGCQLAGVPVVTAMHVANVADQNAAHGRAEKLWDQQRSNVRELQSRHDPMGDYLYALGNAQGWIADTSDPIAIRDLFEKAVRNGSSDAKIVLGIFYFSGVVPGRDSRPYPIRLPKAQQDRAAGVALIQEGIKIRCTYAEPVVDAYSNRTYLRYVSGAAWIWPVYRDGRNDIDAEGHFYSVVAKDPQLEKEWHDLDMQCRASGATSE
jgi:hypothetical protein